MSLTGIAFIFKRFTGFYRVLGQCRRLRRPFIDISSVLLGFTEFFSHRLGFLWISPGRLESQSVFTGFYRVLSTRDSFEGYATLTPTAIRIEIESTSRFTGFYLVF